MADRMDKLEVATALASLPDWRLVADDNAIEREFHFPGFNTAFGFMTRVALAAERGNHHPDWHNSYGSVTIRWSTHSAGGLTELDMRLAKSCDRFAAVLLG